MPANLPGQGAGGEPGAQPSDVPGAVDPLPPGESRFPALPSVPTASSNKRFLGRLLDAYFNPQEEAEEGKQETRREDKLPDGSLAPNAVPPPFATSPPFPFLDHIGPNIGVRDTSVYPLMDAIYRGRNGQAWKDSGIKIYGWMDPSVTFGTSKSSNVPLSYSIVPNSLQLSQAILIFERQPDTVQQDHFDWGFKITNLYGIDYRYTTALGYFSNQLLKHNHLYGYDPLQLYVDLYLPNIAQGVVIRMGRYISPIDIEAQLSPENYLYTHSVMYTYDPYTFTGVQFITKINANYTLQLGVHGGNDMAPWTTSSQVNGELLLKWVSDSGKDSLFGGVDSIGHGYFRNGHDDLQVVAGTYSHKFNEKIHTLTEAYYIFQRNALVGGTVTNGTPHPYFEGTGPGKKIPGLSDSFGIVNYTPYKLTDKSYVVFRSDILADFQGERTGIATTYFEHTLGYIRHLTPWAVIRPEVRFDYTSGARAYDNGTKRNQFTVSSDIIIRF